MIDLFLQGLWIYLGLGLIFALIFQVWGLARVDPGIESSGWLTRLLITPGLIALWPLLVAKWRRVRAGGPGEGPVNRPLPPRGLRGLHRRLVWLLVIPAVVAALAVAVRPQVPGAGRQVPDLAVAPALPTTLRPAETPFGDVPLEIALHGQAEGRVQVEARAAADLAVPSAWLYFSPANAAEGARDDDGLPPASVLLGPVWGPGVQRYLLPAGETGRRGSLSLYSLGWGQRVGTMSIGTENAALGTGSESVPSAPSETDTPEETFDQPQEASELEVDAAAQTRG